MKKRNRWIALMLGILVVFACMPATVFADNDVVVDQADYHGERPFLIMGVEGMDFSGDFLEFDDEHKPYIVVHKTDGDYRLDFKWSEYRGYYLVDKNNKEAFYDIYFTDESEQKARMSIYGENVNAELYFEDFAYYNEVKKIEFIPASTNLFSEDIKSVDPEDGTTYLDLRKRAKHHAGGQTWDSKYAVGDQLIVHYEDDNRTKTFINDDYLDEDENQWYDEFRCGNEENNDFWMYEVSEGGLKAGVNEIVVEYHGRSTKFSITVETPESRAAEEQARKDAEARAKADAEARAKAETEARAIALATASNINKGTVSASDIKKASNLGATSVTLGAKVKKIKKNAFKGTNIKTVTVKTKKLKAKSVKNSLKGSKVKTIKVQVGKSKDNKKFIKTYKKIFTKKNAGKKATVK